VFYGKSTYVLLSFLALRTSQGGQYNCRSEIVVSSEVSTKIVTKDVIVTGQELERLLRCTYLNVGMLSTMVGYSACEFPMQLLCIEVLLINYGIPQNSLGRGQVPPVTKLESLHNWSTISAGMHSLVCVTLRAPEFMHNFFPSMSQSLLQGCTPLMPPPCLSTLLITLTSPAPLCWNQW